MQVVEKIETIIKFSESSGKDILILSAVGFAICCFFYTYTKNNRKWITNINRNMDYRIVNRCNNRCNWYI